ncbi:MAG: hypothetical protein LBG52_04835 [Candidatus Peribacteria bacterium]|jgi:hypothetical protein|nr:hypothetical protein [Candidatus Peribacteria bacterium]
MVQMICIIPVLLGVSEDCEELINALDTHQGIFVVFSMIAIALGIIAGYALKYRTTITGKKWYASRQGRICITLVIIGILVLLSHMAMILIYVIGCLAVLGEK